MRYMVCLAARKSIEFMTWFNQTLLCWPFCAFFLFPCFIESWGDLSRVSSVDFGFVRHGFLCIPPNLYDLLDGELVRMLLLLCFRSLMGYWQWTNRFDRSFHRAFAMTRTLIGEECSSLYDTKTFWESRRQLLDCIWYGMVLLALEL